MSDRCAPTGTPEPFGFRRSGGCAAAPRARPRFRGPSFNRIVSNLLTLFGLCAGLTAMRSAYEGRFGPAVVALVVAGAIDGLDGRLARHLKATSLFGAELDSLAHFLCSASHRRSSVSLVAAAPGRSATRPA